MAQVTVDIMRPGAITAGRRPAPTKVATVTLEIQPLTPDAAARQVAPADISDEILYTQYRVLTVDGTMTPLVPVPDIRMGPPGDLLVDRATPNVGVGSATSSAISATGAQAFTVTPPLPGLAVGDTVFVGGEAVTLTAWTPATGAANAVFVSTHAAGSVVQPATVYVVHGVNYYSDPILGAFLDCHCQVQAQPSQAGG